MRHRGLKYTFCFQMQNGEINLVQVEQGAAQECYNLHNFADFTLACGLLCGQPKAHLWNYHAV